MARLSKYHEKQHHPQIDGVKLEICTCIRRIAMRNGWRQKDLAMRLLVSESTASRIIRLRLDQLTVGQLFNYLARLDAHFRIMISI